MRLYLDFLKCGCLKRLATASVLDLAFLASRAGFMPTARGRGAIFTLHHVRPQQKTDFAPNEHLEVTPQFLSQALTALARDGYRFVRLEDVPALLAEDDGGPPFAAFTLDDGYRNNAEHAAPVFERHGAPFTVFVSRGFAERTHTLWWETLAALLARENRLRFDFGSGEEELDLSRPRRKHDAFDHFANYLWQAEEKEAIARIDALARAHGVDPLEIAARLAMPPEMLRELAAHPLASLGAHTVSHRALARLGDGDAREEIGQSVRYVEEITGTRPAAIAYPYGMARAVSQRDFALAREAGLLLGVTTQPGTLPSSLPGGLFGLPRISLNGHFQRARHVSALASGLPFALLRLAGRLR